MHVKFVIEATPDQFYTWLRVQTQEDYDVGRLNFPHELGPVHLQPVTEEPVVDPHSRVVRLCMRGHQFLTGEDGVLVAAGGFAGNEYIHFKLVPVAERRTEVAARCNVPLIDPYARQLLDAIAGVYPEAAAAIRETNQNWKADLRLWAAAEKSGLPLRTTLPVALEDVDAACHEHLEHLAGKRFPAERDVQVWRAVEQEGSAIRFDIRSANRPVGHLRIRRITAQQTRLELTAEPNATEADLVRLQEILAEFFGRWLGDLDSLVQPSAAGVAPTGEPASDDNAAGTGGSQLEVFPTLEIPLAPDKLYTWLERKYLAPRNLLPGDPGLMTGKRFQYEPSPGPNYIGVFLNIEILEDELTLVTPEILYAHPGLKEQAQLEITHLLEQLTHATVDSRQEDAKQDTDTDADEDVRIAALAHEYGSKLGHKVRANSIRQWEDIARTKRKVINGKPITLRDDQVCERLNMSNGNYRYHKRRMKESGFWQDRGLPD